MNKIVCAAVVALGVLASFGKTVYVDSKLDDYTGHDGTTWEKAFETIQQAIDKAAESGDKIRVASGVYEGGLAMDYGVKTRISGNGRLIVKLNGENLGEPLQGPCELTELKFTNALAENSLTFEYLPGVDDTGSAELVKLVRNAGTLLIVR